MDIWAAAERFAGWGVVVWIVVWLTKRWEVRMDAISTAIAAQTTAMAQISISLTTLSNNLEMHRAFSAQAVAGLTERLEEVGDVLKKVGVKLS